MKLDEVAKKQWDETAETWVRFVRSGKNYYSEYLNGPSIEADDWKC
jgi:hypothetical protein